MSTERETKRILLTCVHKKLPGRVFQPQISEHLLKNVQRSIDRFKLETRKDQQLTTFLTRNRRSDFDPDIIEKTSVVLNEIFVDNEINFGRIIACLTFADTQFDFCIRHNRDIYAYETINVISNFLSKKKLMTGYNATVGGILLQELCYHHHHRTALLFDNTLVEKASFLAKRIVKKPMSDAELGINYDTPKFPNYAVIDKRIQSFKPWPEYLPIKDIRLLAEAGLVYTGVGDSVRCYHCGGGLRNWEFGDDPWQEHAKWYPSCAHVLLSKAKWYVDAVARGDVIRDDKKPPSPTVSELLDGAIAQSCIRTFFEKPLVERAIRIYMGRNNGSAGFSSQDLCEILFELEDTGAGNEQQSAPEK